MANLRVSIEATLKGTTVPVIKRSEITPDWMYSVQNKAPAGQWLPSLQTNAWNSAVDHAEFARSRGLTTRIVDNCA